MREPPVKLLQVEKWWYIFSRLRVVRTPTNPLERWRMTVPAWWLAVAPAYPTIVRKFFSPRERRRTFFSYHEKRRKNFSRSEKGEFFSLFSEKERKYWENQEKQRKYREILEKFWRRFIHVPILPYVFHDVPKYTFPYVRNSEKNFLLERNLGEG